MKNFRKLVVAVTVLGAIGTAGVAYATTTATTPAEITSKLTGKTIDEVNKERASDKTYGTMAKEAGKLDEFKVEMLQQKKAVLDERVKEGTITQEQADEIYNSIKNNQASCDGNGSSKIGKKFGIGFGKGNRNGQGNGNCKGQGNFKCSAISK